MELTSPYFVLFFTVILIMYWLLRQAHRQNFFLLVASYLFYAWFDVLYTALLAISSVIDYHLGRALAGGHSRRKLLLVISLTLNLGTLGVFRYFNFFSESVAVLLNSLGWRVDAVVLNIFVPLGISFYTFKKISYIIDVYRTGKSPAGNFVEYALYVAFFPQILAGPIERARKLIPQFQQTRVWRGEFFYDAWQLLLMGLFKKIVIADSIALVANRTFMLSEPSKVLAFAASLGFTLQILADFSAYTDLSRGFARLLGFETSENFHSPYLARTPTEFWNRWHITLSEWLRDYLFFPIRRALLQRERTLHPAFAWVIPPLATMLLSGLWHGAGWNFVLWGLLHGVLIAVYQVLGFGGSWSPRGALRQVAAWAVMFVFIIFSWIIFRSPSLDWFSNVLLTAPFSRGQADWVVTLASLSAVAFYAAPLVIKLLIDRYFTRLPLIEPAYYALAAVMVVVFSGTPVQDFVYFRF